MQQEARSRFGLIEFNDAPPEVQDVYAEVQEAFDLPFVMALFKCQGKHPLLLKGNWEKTKAVLFQGSLPVVLKYMIVHSGAKSRESSYCTKAFGILTDRLSHEFSNDGNFRITNNLFAAQIPLRYRNAVKVVTKAALNPQEIKDEDFTSLKEEGFSERDVMELMALADLACMFNTIADIADLSIDANFLVG